MYSSAKRDREGGRGAAQARSGVDQNYLLELGANKQVYASQVDAAGQICNAGLEAAKLRQAEAVIAAVGREISREVGQEDLNKIGRATQQDAFVPADLFDPLTMVG